MDIAGAQELARRIEQQKRDLGDTAVSESTPAPGRFASIEAFDHMEYDESDVGSRPALRQWMAHHDQTYGSRRAPGAPEAMLHGSGPEAPTRHLFSERRATARPRPAHAAPAPSTAVPFTSLPTTLYVNGSREPRGLTVAVSVILSVAAAAGTSFAVVHFDHPSSAVATPGAGAAAPGQTAAAPVVTTTVAAPAAQPGSTPAPAPATGSPIALTAVGSYNPFGTGPENEADAARAVDGKASTYWSTETYVHNGFQKPGTGLLLAAPTPTLPGRVVVSTATPGYEAEVRIGNSPHGPFAADSAWRTVGPKTSFSLRGRSGRYLLLWLRLPSHEGSARVNEVQASAATSPTGA